jgi:hypothetical protein
MIDEAFRLSMGKSELLRMMTNARNNFTLGLAGVLMLDHGNISDIRGKSSLVLGENYELPFDQVASLLGEDYGNKLAVLFEFLNMLLRTFVKEAYELLKAYCRDTGQLRQDLPRRPISDIMTCNIRYAAIGSFQSRCSRSSASPGSGDIRGLSELSPQLFEAAFLLGKRILNPVQPVLLLVEGSLTPGKFVLPLRH